MSDEENEVWKKVGKLAKEASGDYPPTVKLGERRDRFRGIFRALKLADGQYGETVVCQFECEEQPISEGDPLEDWDSHGGLVDVFFGNAALVEWLNDNKPDFGIGVDIERGKDEKMSSGNRRATFTIKTYQPDDDVDDDEDGDEEEPPKKKAKKKKKKKSKSREL